MRFVSRLATAVLAMVWPLHLANAAPVTIDLPASDKWHMNYEEGSCNLLRTFGSGDDAIIALFTEFAPGDSFNLRLFGKPFKSEGPFQDVRVASGVTPAAESLKNRLSGEANKIPFVDIGKLSLAGPVLDYRAALISMSPEQEAAVTMLTIGPQRGKIYRLQMGSMRAPMQAMRTCTDDLVRFWGYDPAAMASYMRTVAPISSPGSWVQPHDYPDDQLRNGKLGAVDFRLDVDETGKATGCSILRRAGDEAFAKTTCDLILRRAQFLPALDREGKPAKSYYVSRVNWVQGLTQP